MKGRTQPLDGWLCGATCSHADGICVDPRREWPSGNVRADYEGPVAFTCSKPGCGRLVASYNKSKHAAWHRKEKAA